MYRYDVRFDFINNNCVGFGTIFEMNDSYELVEDGFCPAMPSSHRDQWFILALYLYFWTLISFLCALLITISFNLDDDDDEITPPRINSVSTPRLGLEMNEITPPRINSVSTPPPSYDLAMRQSRSSVRNQ